MLAMSTMITDYEKCRNLYLKKCDDESRKKIEQKLSDIRNVNDLEEIDCTFSEKEMIFDEDSISEIEEQMEMWKYLAKLSVYLYNDYEFFSQLIVKNESDSPLLHSIMKNIGYTRKGKAWFQGEKPDKDVIVHNIFIYWFYSFLFKSLKEKETNAINEYNEKLANEKSNKNKQKDVFQNDNKKKENTKYLVKEDQNYWICDICTYKNRDVLNKNCSICGSERETSDKGDYFQYKEKITNLKDEKNKNWSTRNECNFDQKNTIDILSSDKSEEISPGWNCVKCTYFNEDLNNFKCSMCEEWRTLNKKTECLRDEEKTENRKSLIKNIKGKTSLGNTTNNTIHSDNWTCKRCIFANSSSTQVCEVCLEIKEIIGEGRDLELPEETWICKRCKTSNSFNRYKCSKCKELADIFNKWVCEMCRFFNDKSAIKCGACDNKNPNIVKCSQCKEKWVYRNEICVECLQLSQMSLSSIRVGNEKKNGRSKIFGNIEDQTNHTRSENSYSTDVMKDKRCLNYIRCGSKLAINDHYWCKKCWDLLWFCPNEDCGTINFMNKYCKECKLEKDSDVSNCRNVTVLKDNKPTQMWMCGLCKNYTAGTLHKCSHCKNIQDSPNISKCRCGWNNLPFRDKCENCSKIIKKFKILK